ncbi:ABC transporter permease [Terracidiphilus gabretensis]|uniref:ABC transporter permease n=1 Tax=Terracidiphilus gabretensis TaxID=1577687 RepID=UPI00071B0148|nr:ABC transporter permease [Terracidiphilus gabretensis]
MFAILQTAFASLRRDRAALALAFILPIGFFSIFAVIFGSMHDTVPRVKVIIVDQDNSEASKSLVNALLHEDTLRVSTHPEASKAQPNPPDYTAQSAEASVKAGDVSVALIIPQGWGANPISFGQGQDQNTHKIQLLNDSSDAIAPQVVSGMLQKAAMTSLPATMAEMGQKYTEKYIGTLTPEQRKQWNDNLAYLKRLQQDRTQTSATTASASPTSSSSGSGFNGIISVQTRSVVGESQNKPMISYYAAAVGVMFLLFTASSSAGALLDEADSGTLDRVLSSRIGMTTLLAGKLTYNTLLAFTQLTAMFVFGWAVFHLDLWTHIPGFLVMGLSTAFAVAAFGMLLASLAKTRAQLGAISTLLILTMSSIGGSMFPRYLMSDAMQKAGQFTLNSWAIDGFTKVFWRDQPVTALWPQVAVLLGAGAVLFLLGRRFARRWEFS